jgi:hypothetical protein
MLYGWGVWRAEYGALRPLSGAKIRAPSKGSGRRLPLVPEIAGNRPTLVTLVCVSTGSGVVHEQCN